MSGTRTAPLERVAGRLATYAGVEAGPRHISFFVCSLSCFTSPVARVIEQYEGALSTRPQTSARPLSEPSTARSAPAGAVTFQTYIPPPCPRHIWRGALCVETLLSRGVTRPSSVVNKGVLSTAPTAPKGVLSMAADRLLGPSWRVCGPPSGTCAQRMG